MVNFDFTRASIEIGEISKLVKFTTATLSIDGQSTGLIGFLGNSVFWRFVYLTLRGKRWFYLQSSLFTLYSCLFHFHSKQVSVLFCIFYPTWNLVCVPLINTSLSDSWCLRQAFQSRMLLQPCLFFCIRLSVSLSQGFVLFSAAINLLANTCSRALVWV